MTESTPADVQIEDYDESNPDHVALTEGGAVCALQNEGGESTADLSQVTEQPAVVPDGS